MLYKMPLFILYSVTHMSIIYLYILQCRKIVSLESLGNNLEEKRSHLACSINCSLACPSQLQLKLKNTVQSKASKSAVLANFLRRGLRQTPLDGKAQIWRRNFGCFREYRLGDYTTRTYSCPVLSKLSRVVGLHALRKMH